jgi:hypothetical protein
MSKRVGLFCHAARIDGMVDVEEDPDEIGAKAATSWCPPLRYMCPRWAEDPTTSS